MTAAYAHILVIDADAARSRRMTRPFAEWGWRATRVAADAAAAIATAGAGAGAGDIDLVLIEIAAAEHNDHAILRAWAARPALWAIPVVVTAPPKTKLERLARCISLGASDYLTHPFNPVLLRARIQNSLQKRLLTEQAGEALQSFNEQEKLADDLRLVVLPLGAALLAEPGYDALLARVISEARAICNADGGILYFAESDGSLRAAHAQVGSLDIDLGGGAADNRLAALTLDEADIGQQGLAWLVARAAAEGESANIAELGPDRRLGGGHSFPLEQQFGYVPRSALVVPLHNGTISGALLLVNCRDPRTDAIVPFDGYHQMVAESMASQAAIVLNNRLLTERQIELTRYKQELQIAREIQISFLPADTPQPEGWDVAARFRPAFDVAGDFFDFIRLPHGLIALVISDVVGKGVTAAMYMAIIRSLFRALLGQYYQAEAAGSGPAPAHDDREALVGAVSVINAYLATTHQDDHIFATLFCGLLDPTTGCLLYVNAGHNPPYLLHPAPEGETHCHRLVTTGPAIGLSPSAAYRPEEVVLEPADMLLAFTDGVPDARDPTGRPLGNAALEELLQHDLCPAAMLDAVLERVERHAAGAAAYDDITMFAVRRLPSPNSRLLTRQS